MSRTIIILGLLLALVSTAAVWGWKEAIRVDGLYSNEIELRKAAEARTAVIQKSLRTVSSNYATSEQRLRVVLAATPDRPTAGPVYNELCRRANCAKLDPLPTPAD